MYYFHIKDNQIIGKGQARLLNAENIEVSEDVYNESEKYIYQDGEIILDPEFEAKEAQKERERIAKLFLTGADVERGIYQAKGMDFDDIITLVEHLSKGELDLETGEIINKSVDIDVKALKIELKANHFYRGNPYVSAIGGLLGFTSEQLDKFFETNDYTTLLSQSDKVEGESDKVSDKVEEPVKDEV